MEGNAALFKRFAGIDAFPICLDTQDPDEIVRTVQVLAPVFAGINLEDISAPRCFEIEQRLRDLDRKSTRLNSSHANISYAVFCLKKKKKIKCYHAATLCIS